MLACTALVGCTNEDVIDNPNENPVNGADGKVYMAVKLDISDAPTSRATEDGGYNTGLTAEQAIFPGNSIFLFYDEAGKWVTSGVVQKQTANPEHGVTGVDIHNQACVVLAGTDDGIKKITQVLTVLNYNDIESLLQKDLNDALDELANATTEADGTEDGFLMSTAVYTDANNTTKNNVAPNNANGDIICNTTAIDANTHFKTTEIQAMEDSPVIIHVERVAAKVQVLAKETYAIEEEGEETTTQGDIHLNGVPKEVTINILGWKLNNINETTSIVKNIAKWNSADPFNGWNITWTNGTATYGRSFWAEGTKYGYKGYDTADGNTHELTAYKFSDADNVATSDVTTAAYEYCWEQTVETAKAGRGTELPNVTTVLIAAQFTFDEAVEGTDYFKYNGVYFTENEFKKIILNQIKSLGYKTYGSKAQPKLDENGNELKDENNNTITVDVTGYWDLDVEDLKIVTDGSLAGILVTVDSDNKYYTTSTDADGNITATEVEQKTINDKITTEAATYLGENVEGYVDGKCYYQIPIEHYPSTNAAPLYGVVRNHWYQLSINKVKHIGEAVYNPEVAIPQIPAKDTEYYLAAELHVLSWKVVEQDVELD